MTITFTDLRADLHISCDAGKSFEESIEQLVPKINECAAQAHQYKADNWQMVIDTLAYIWWESEYRNEKISAERIDALTVKHSPYGKEALAIIAQQKQSAREWAADLEEADMNPFEALAGATQVCERVVAVAQLETALAASPSPIATPQAIVQMYRTFYRASTKYQVKMSDAIRPLRVAIDVVNRSSSKGEALAQEVTGSIAAKMRQIRAGTAQGRWVLSDKQDELAAVSQFSNFIVHNVLGQKFSGDKAQFSSRSGIGLIVDACVYLYQLEQDKENG
jgi:CRISPR type I-D-associated protein Csc3/Cas10d